MNTESLDTLYLGASGPRGPSAMQVVDGSTSYSIACLQKDPAETTPLDHHPGYQVPQKGSSCCHYTLLGLSWCVVNGPSSVVHLVFKFKGVGI